MKSICVLAVLAIVGCQDLGQQVRVTQETDVNNMPSVIQKISADLYVINRDSRLGPFTSYIPLNLPNGFEVDGLQVLVTGKTELIPLSIGYPGTPLRISSIVTRN